MTYDAIIPTKIGNLGISLNQGRLTQIDFDVKQDVTFNGSDEVVKIAKQLQQYFESKQQNFNIAVDPAGTEHQIKVWKALQQIPYGETRTYGAIATQLNSSARAVGNACRRNPIPIVIPCHRVVAKTGIGGFSGQTKGFQIDRKQALLKLETTS